MLTVTGPRTKNGQSRIINLNSEALVVLERWKQQSNGLLLFSNYDGNRLSYLKTAWSKLLLEAQITNFRWHDLRHTFASNLVMKGVDLNTVRELLGHTDIAMTLRYAHLSSEHKADAVQKLCA
jgi:site-specific recombinase XerD